MGALELAKSSTQATERRPLRRWRRLDETRLHRFVINPEVDDHLGRWAFVDEQPSVGAHAGVPPLDEPLDSLIHRGKSGRCEVVAGRSDAEQVVGNGLDATVLGSEQRVVDRGRMVLGERPCHLGPPASRELANDVSHVADERGN